MISQRARWSVRAAAIAVVVLVATGLGACAPRLQDFGAGDGEAAIVESRFADRHFVASDGYLLPYRAWEAARPRALILALHGFNDYSNAFATAGAWWAERGVTTYAYDQRGFGETTQRGVWPGRDRLTRDLREVAGLVAARHPGVPLYLLGESMGGAVVLATEAEVTAGLARWRVPPAGLVLAAPAVWGRSTMPLFYRVMLWLGAYTMPWNTVSGRGLEIMPSDNIPMLRALSRDPLVIKETRIDAVHGLVNLMDAGLAAAALVERPTLLLYGARDEIVPKRPTARFLEALAAPPRAVVYGEGYHMLLRDLQAEQVWRDIRAWIAEPRGPLPSGEEVATATQLRTKVDVESAR